MISWSLSYNFTSHQFPPSDQTPARRTEQIPRPLPLRGARRPPTLSPRDKTRPGKPLLLPPSSFLIPTPPQLGSEVEPVRRKKGTVGLANVLHRVCVLTFSSKKKSVFFRKSLACFTLCEKILSRPKKTVVSRVKCKLVPLVNPFAARFLCSKETQNLQKHELCSATTWTPPLESTHWELSFEWSHL